MQDPNPRDLAQHLSYCRGAAVELIARAGEHGDAIDALTAAKDMLDREIALITADRAEMRAGLLADLGVNVAEPVAQRRPQPGARVIPFRPRLG